LDFELFTDRVIWQTDCSYEDCRTLWRSGVENTDNAITILSDAYSENISLESAILDFMEEEEDCRRW
jgi:hypothetical protein